MGSTVRSSFASLACATLCRATAAPTISTAANNTCRWLRGAVLMLYLPFQLADMQGRTAYVGGNENRLQSLAVSRLPTAAQMVSYALPSSPRPNARNSPEHASKLKDCVYRKLVLCRGRVKQRPELFGLPESTLKLLGDADGKGLALESIFRVVLVKVVEIQRRVPPNGAQPDLATDAVSLIAGARIARAAPRLAGDLPRVVTGRADLDQEGLSLVQRQILADAPVECKIVAGRDREVRLVAARFVGQRGHDGGAHIGHRIPHDRALNLLLPETQPDVVRRSCFHRPNDRERYGLCVVFPDRCVESVPQRKVPVWKLPTEPDRHHEQVSDAEAGRAGVYTPTILGGQPCVKARVGERGCNVCA